MLAMTREEQMTQTARITLLAVTLGLVLLAAALLFFGGSVWNDLGHRTAQLVTQ